MRLGFHNVNPALVALCEEPGQTWPNKQILVFKIFSLLLYIKAMLQKQLHFLLE